MSKFFWLSVAEKIFIYENNGVGYLGLLKIIHFAILPSGIIYIIMSIALIGEHRKNISNLVSHLEINLNWLRNLMIGMCMIWLSILFGNDIFTFTLVDLYILFIGYFGIKQVGMFTNKVIPLPANHLDMGLLGASEDIPLRSAKVKYEKSVIGDRFSSEIHFQVTQLMQQEKLFKDPDLGLNELAEQLKIHPNALSQVINTLENKNFYDYINELRVEEFKCILMQPENQKFTLLALAYEVGFNSKTSFNRNFKKKTGLSPTAYLKQQKIHLQATI
ncbi:hypothetical protein GCM10011413_04890 [Pedobacter psychrotolerans]|uniref:HTH araC/xylS-type domain-containing protein n=1 Tax=Pedobacter psychrotolerans TaxID=1843235 RepID=A0ABQ1SIQ3_9SPHI|nr:hypothetical protein GCM10011413_04890 [Pedobacter psychrotolerans]